MCKDQGTAAGEVQLPTAGGGGWAAHGANRAVNLGGAGDPVVWGTLSPPFLAFNNGSSTSYGDLVLGSPTGTHTVDFQNPILLNNAATSFFRDLIVNDGPAALDARISGGISQTADPLTSTTSLDLEIDGTLEISGPMSGEIHLGKSGTGTAIISGTNTRSGDVYVYEGTLTFASDASWNQPEDIYVDMLGELDVSALTSPVGVLINDSISVYGTLLGDVATPSYFDGYGTVDGDLHSQAGGYVFPDYEDLLHVTGDFTLDATAFIDFFIYGHVPQEDFNQMRVGGAVNLSGGLYLGNSGGVTLAVNDSFVFLLNDGSDPITGTFDGLPEGSTVSLGNGLAAQITYQANGDGGLTGNDFGITVVPDSADLALTATAPLLVDLGSEIVVSLDIDNPGPAAISDGVLEITLPANATFVSSTPAGTVNEGELSISLPAIAAPGTTNVEVHFTAPATAAAVTVSATVSSGATDPDAGNNTATTTTAVLPGGRVEITSYVTNPGGADATLTLDTLSGVHYSYQTSLDLLDWSEKSYFTGDGLPHIVITPIDKPAEFFRFAIEP